MSVPPDILQSLYNSFRDKGQLEKAARLQQIFDFTTGERKAVLHLWPVTERIVPGVGDVEDDIVFVDRTGGTCLAHLEGVGWSSIDFNSMNSGPAPEAFNNTPPQPWQMMGTTGQGRRLEAFVLPRLTCFSMNSNFINEEIFFRYRCHAGGIGWMPEVESPQMTGTTGQGRRLEAVIINVFPQTVSIGAQTFQLRVFYRTHLEGIGWTGWTGGGNISGTTGQNRRLEAMQIRVYLIR